MTETSVIVRKDTREYRTRKPKVIAPIAGA